MYPTFKNSHTRSMFSTPERKSEITHENPDKEVASNDITFTRNSDSSVIYNSKGKKRYSKNRNINISNVNNKNNQLNSSSSNLSDKSRISSVVYPSKKKKNPKN